MSEDPDLGQLMSDYIQDRALSAEQAPPVERFENRAIPFPHVEFDYRGRAMELPTVTFKPSLARDDQGDYVVVEWGYSRGHHSVSAPVTIKDRRAEMIEAVLANQTALQRTHDAQRRSALEAEFTSAQDEINDLATIAGNADEIRVILQRETEVAQQLARFRSRHLDAAQTKLLKLLTARNEAELELMAPVMLQERIAELQRLVDRLQSLMPEVDAATQPTADNFRANQSVHQLFLKGGLFRESTTRNSVSVQSRRELDMLDVHDSGRPPMGTITFSAQGLHIPKPIPLVEIALGSLMTWTALQPEPLWGQETLGSQVQKAGGIYRTVSFSSRTGRHSGYGYMACLPLKSSSEVMQEQQVSSE